MDDYGDTFLHVAAHSRKEKVEKNLIDRSADSKDLVDCSRGVSSAAEGGSVGLIMHSLERGKDIDQFDKSAIIALRVAAFCGKKEAARYLTGRAQIAKAW